MQPCPSNMNPLAANPCLLSYCGTLIAPSCASQSKTTQGESMKQTLRILILPLHKDGKLINSPVAHLVRFVALLAIVCGAGTYASAQTERFQAGIDFVTLFPRGEFRDNVDNNGYGLGGTFLVRLWKSPI